MIKYQEELVKRINYQIENNIFPNTSLFIGENGCGKHTLISYISDKLNIPISDITDIISNEVIESIYTDSLSRIYVININKVSLKIQNVILKFIEEPPENSYIILIATTKSIVIPTVLNRCFLYTFSRYTEDQLRAITGICNEMIFKYTNTPGQVLLFKDDDINNYIEYIDRMLILIKKANWANILRLKDKLFFNSEQENKLSFFKFCSIILRRTLELYLDKKIPYSECIVVQNFIKDTNIKNIDNEKLFENFIFKLKEASI